MATSREFLIKLHFYPRDTMQQVMYALEKARQIMTQSDFIVHVADQAKMLRRCLTGKSTTEEERNRLIKKYMAVPEQ